MWRQGTRRFASEPAKWARWAIGLTEKSGAVREGRQAEPALRLRDAGSVT